ncbi:MAG: FHA domain-containing protein [Deltaproteobacteria bacterium]|nr:FHA domain-containing protein [Deltaproteobacteria bacterium]
MALELRSLQSGERFVVDGGGAVIGRVGGPAEITVADQSVSKRHARVFQDAGAWFVEDLKSVNGTIVDGKRIRERVAVRVGFVFGVSPRHSFEVMALGPTQRPAGSFVVVVEEPGFPLRAELFTQNELTLGRVVGNDIVLPRAWVSKRHLRLVLRDGKLIVVDLKSTNGTLVNGRRIVSPQVLKPADVIELGDYRIGVDVDGAVAPTVGTAPFSEPFPPPYERELEGSGPTAIFTLAAKPKPARLVIDDDLDAVPPGPPRR